jgi:hypothetical protein
MGIYIDINGTWGPADELVIIDDSTWESGEYAEMSLWTDSMIVKFAEEPHGLTPTEWVAKHYPQLLEEIV